MKHFRVKIKGFSLIEVMATIAIMGILATIAAPNYQKMRQKALYQSEVQKLIEVIIDARNAALTNKKCSVTPDRSSTVWKVVLNTYPLDYQLKCFYDDTNSIDEALITPIHAEMKSITMAPVAANVEDITFSFFSGAANGKLEYTESSTLKKGDSVQMVFGQLEASLQSTICFNPVSGFPTFNKFGSSCQVYN